MRRTELIEERIRGIRSASALTDDAAVIGPHQLLVAGTPFRVDTQHVAPDGCGTRAGNAISLDRDEPQRYVLLA